MKSKRKPKPIKPKQLPYVLVALAKHFERVKV